MLGNRAMVWLGCVFRELRPCNEAVDIGSDNRPLAEKKLNKSFDNFLIALGKAQRVIDAYLARRGVLAANAIAKLEDYRDRNKEAAN